VRPWLRQRPQAEEVETTRYSAALAGALAVEPARYDQNQLRVSLPPAPSARSPGRESELRTSRLLLVAWLR